MTADYFGRFTAPVAAADEAASADNPISLAASIVPTTAFFAMTATSPPSSAVARTSPFVVSLMTEVRFPLVSATPPMAPLTALFAAVPTSAPTSDTARMTPVQPRRGCLGRDRDVPRADYGPDDRAFCHRSHVAADVGSPFYGALTVLLTTSVVTVVTSWTPLSAPTIELVVTAVMFPPMSPAAWIALIWRI